MYLTYLSTALRKPIAVIAQLGGVEGGLDVLLPANEMERGNLFFRFERAFDAFDDDTRAVVATHDIHYDSHKWRERGRLPLASAISQMNQAPAVMVMTWRPL